MTAKKGYILLLLVLLRVQLCFSANTVVVPDANFRAFLIANYPGVMSGPLLDTIAAAGVTGALNCRAKSISDITGIQYFKGLTFININNNSIDTIPPLKGFINLQGLYCDTNLISNLPVLKKILTLRSISCKKNNLTSLPTLSGLTALEFISCSMNQITALPSLNGLTMLTTLDCSENQITQLPNLDSQTNLENLYCGMNHLQALPSLQNLTNLQILYCGGNLLTSLPDLSHCLMLKMIRISGNKITVLPTLTFTAAPTQVYLDNNNLTFEDLLPVVNNAYYSAATFTLFPQNNFGNYADTLVKQGGTFHFNLLIDGAVSTNTYKWYKNGIYLPPVSSTNSYTKTNADLTDIGSYSVVVKNSDPRFSGDSLVSTVKNLNVADCFSGTITYSSSSISCKEGFRILIEKATSGGTPPFKYVLTDLSTGKKRSSSLPALSGIKEGDYSLILKDSANCETAPLFFQLVSGTDCDPVFSPNGDGVVDTYFISTPGKARIFDKTGTLINELNTPAYWDGNDKTGNEVPSGYYAIIVNEKTTTNVSLMR